MSRAFIILLDSFGIGSTSDAAKYGDAGANTLGHIADACFQGKANQDNYRTGPLSIPHLLALGLNEALKISTGTGMPGISSTFELKGAFGCAEEISFGKDTPSGHWEIAGVPALFDWGYFPPEFPSFPEDLIDLLMERAALPGVLGNKHASGTDILIEFGKIHQETGKPIVYTSGDSVFQIAAHEESFGLEALYKVCKIARELVDEYNVGRVIARPFLGRPGNYYRTGNRKDYAVPPPKPTLLDYLIKSQRNVIAIGKVADIYAHRGISKSVKADGNMALFDAFLKEAESAPAGSLVFVNLVDFDMLYGHRRNVIGYAKALEDFDKRLPAFLGIMKEGDLAIITADHGCDPTWKGSDHTRENIPILAFGPQIQAVSLGKRQTFADIGQTLASHLKIPPLEYGSSFYEDLLAKNAQ